MTGEPLPRTGYAHLDAERQARNATYAARGRHEIMDLAGCDHGLLNDARMLRHMLTRAVEAIGATVLMPVVYEYEPQGVSVVLILAESHASLHTYPEHGVIMVDVFTCGDNMNPQEALAYVARTIPHARRHDQSLMRGVAPRRR